MTNWSDMLNGTFECAGGVAAWANVRALTRARRAAGIVTVTI